MRVLFDPSESSSSSSSADQTGQGGLQHHHYFQGLPPYQRGYGYFAGFPRQRGAGIGDVIRRVWRFLKPSLMSAGKAIGQEGLATTARTLSDVVQGTNVKDAITNQGLEGVGNLLGKAQETLKSKRPQQQGKGRGKRGRTRKDKVILKPIDLIGTSVSAKAVNKNKRKKIDNLGPY